MATAQQVTQLYSELLGRAPDPGGLAYYQTYADPNAIRSSILGSAEYRTKSTTRPPDNSNQVLQDFAKQQADAQDALLARQKSEQEGLFNTYETQRNNQEALPALYTRLQNEAGIPELGKQAQIFKDEIYKTKDQLDRLGEDVTARTTGTLATDAQRRRLLTAEQEPLETNLGRLGTGLAPVADMLSSAQANLGTMFSLNEQQQEREMEPIKLRINAISDRFAREITGFDSNKQTQLTAILDKLQRDRQLSDQNWELAQQLAAEERAYSRQKSLAASSLSGSGIYSGGGGSSSPAPAAAAAPKYSDWTLGGAQSINLNSPGLSPGVVATAPKNSPIPLFSSNNSADPLGILGRKF